MIGCEGVMKWYHDVRVVVEVAGVSRTTINNNIPINFIRMFFKKSN